MVTTDDIKDIMSKIEVIKENIKNIDTKEDLYSQGIDSLDMMNVFLLIEEKYGIKIPDEDIAKLNTIEKITSYLNEKVKWKKES